MVIIICYINVYSDIKKAPPRTLARRGRISPLRDFSRQRSFGGALLPHPAIRANHWIAGVALFPSGVDHCLWQNLSSTFRWEAGQRTLIQVNSIFSSFLLLIDCFYDVYKRVEVREEGIEPPRGNPH